MIKGFEFTEGGRDYSCMVEQRFGQESEHWWWFNVSGDGQRYAPFQATRDDTRTSVQKRIVAFYEHRLWVRAQPVQRGAQFGSRPAAIPAPKVIEVPVVVAKKAPVKAASKTTSKGASKSSAKSATRAKSKSSAKGQRSARA